MRRVETKSENSKYMWVDKFSHQLIENNRHASSTKRDRRVHVDLAENLMKTFEILVLILVVIHSAQHLPGEVAKAHEHIKRFVERLGRGEWTLRLAVAVLTALAASIAVSPVIYYGLECTIRLIGGWPGLLDA